MISVYSNTFLCVFGQCRTFKQSSDIQLQTETETVQYSLLIIDTCLLVDVPATVWIPYTICTQPVAATLSDVILDDLVVLGNVQTMVLMIVQTTEKNTPN